MNKILSILALISCSLSFAADNIQVPANVGKAYLRDSSNRLWPAEIAYTTDGNGNPIPIGGSSSSPLQVSLVGQQSAGNVRNVYSSVNVGSVSWVQMIASTAVVANAVEIFDSSGQTLEFGVGAAASEIRQFLITPGGNGRLPMLIPQGSRISIRAVSGTASTGEIDINLYK